MKLFVKEMVPDERIVTFFALDAKELKESRNKKPYLLLTLSDKTGVIQGYLWKNPAQTAGSLKPGAFVKVIGTPMVIKGIQVINVDRVRAARKGEIDRTDFAKPGQLELFGNGYDENSIKEMAAR